MDDYMPRIQEQVRTAFPRFRKGTLHALQIGPAGQPQGSVPVNRWEFANKENDSGFILQLDSFIFHTTAYQTFENFLDQFQNTLTSVHKILKLSLVERIGLRYIDVIEPAVGVELTDYLVPGLAGFPYSQFDAKSIVTRTESIAATEIGKLVLRCTKSAGGELIPSELFPITLKLPRTVDKEKITAMLDSDHYTERSFDFGVDTISKLMSQLHEIISQAFWTVITDKAYEQWR
jgi:uncharacterized protein (TIGR04255 family)